MLDGNLMEMNLRRLVSVLESRMEPYCIGCMRNDFLSSCMEAVIGVDLVQRTVVIRRAVGVDFTILWCMSRLDVENEPDSSRRMVESCGWSSTAMIASPYRYCRGET